MIGGDRHSLVRFKSIGKWFASFFSAGEGRERKKKIELIIALLCRSPEAVPFRAAAVGPPVAGVSLVRAATRLEGRGRKERPVVTQLETRWNNDEAKQKKRLRSNGGVQTTDF